MWVNLVEWGVQPSEIENVSWVQYLNILLAKKEIQDENSQSGVEVVETPEDMMRHKRG